MTKMKTLYMLFEAIHAGRINKDTRIPCRPMPPPDPPTKIGFRRRVGSGGRCGPCDDYEIRRTNVCCGSR
ncbi:hypothetical protein VXQ18_03950 [Brucella abortus]|nr:hypothetical protein [Brucella abortus]